MKQIYLFMVMLLMTFVVGNAQSMLVTTLSHEGTITTYTGNSGLQDAYRDAVDGDIITLSAGSFRAQNIEKKITIRGAGMGVKVNADEPYIEPTFLIGSFEITADGTSDNRLKMEGLVCEESVYLCGVSNALFSKCRFEKIEYSAGKGGFENTTFINCIISGITCYNASMNFFGCYLKNLITQESGSLHNMTNCIIETDTSNETYWVVKNSIFIITAPDVKVSAVYSLWTGEECPQRSNFYATLEARHNTIAPKDLVVFKEGTFFQLTDETKQYVGDDGTEIGLYGGSLPFDPTPTNPQITRFNVAPKTTLDGKLSIDIEVNAK